MENTINDRITMVRKSLNLSQTAFGEKLGVSRGVIKNIDESNTVPKPEFVSLVCKVYNVDRDWLETGSGDMFLPMEEEDEFLAYAVELIHDKDKDWLKQLNLTLMHMSPEELDALEKFARNWLERMKDKEKEQDL